jgi:hypothetical protein
MPKEFRSETFREKELGAYILVYQRPGENVRLNLNYFDSDCSEKHAQTLLKILTNALAKVKEWKK